MSKRAKILSSLLGRLEMAKGSDRPLDAVIEEELRGRTGKAPAYTGSIDQCLELLHDILPNWHWHIGRDASGVFPYVTLSKGQTTARANGVTVPLVLLTAIIKALIEQEHKPT